MYVAQNQALPEDIMRNTVSDYMTVEEIRALSDEVLNLQIKYGRELTKRYTDEKGSYNDEVYIDGVLRRHKLYNGNKLVSENNYDSNGSLDGVQKYFRDGSLFLEQHYRNGTLHGHSRF